MEAVTILLAIIGLIILMVPTTYEVPLRQCKPHRWVKKPSGYMNVDYMACEKCGQLPGRDDKEA